MAASYPPNRFRKISVVDSLHGPSSQ